MNVAYVYVVVYVVYSHVSACVHCYSFACRQVSFDEAASLARSWGVPFFETSAKTRINIEESVFALIREIPRAGTDYKVVSCACLTSVTCDGGLMLH